MKLKNNPIRDLARQGVAVIDAVTRFYRENVRQVRVSAAWKCIRLPQSTIDRRNNLLAILSYGK